MFHHLVNLASRRVDKNADSALTGWTTLSNKICSNPRMSTLFWLASWLEQIYPDHMDIMPGMNLTILKNKKFIIDPNQP